MKKQEVVLADLIAEAGIAVGEELGVLTLEMIDNAIQKIKEVGVQPNYLIVDHKTYEWLQTQEMLKNDYSLY